MEDTEFAFAKQSPVDIFLTEDGRKLMRYIDRPSYDITWYIDLGDGDGWERMDLSQGTWYSLNRGASNYERHHEYSIQVETGCDCE